MKLSNVMLSLMLGTWVLGCGEVAQQVEETASVPPLPSAPSSIGTKENPQARFEYERRQLVDPHTNTIPAGIHQKELSFARKIQQRQAQLGTENQQTWTLAGPSNVGGRTRGLVIDVRDENIILAGGVSGGMWRTTNGGLNWSRTSQPAAINSVTCLVQDTRIGKRDNWYFGTGELLGNSARASDAPYRGDGLFKSTDGGQSWDILASTTTNQPASFDNPFNYSWNLAINPLEPFTNDVIYAAIYGNIVKSTDGGQSWVKVLGEPNLLEDKSGDLNNSNASFYTNIMITPLGQMYAYLSTATSTGINTTDKGIFHSTDGENWANITPPNFNALSERLVMSYAPSNENIVYFLVEGLTIQLWKYDQVRWTNLSNQIPDGNNGLESFDSQGSYNLTVKVHPDDSDLVFLGGTNLYRSTDGFATSTHITQIGGYDTEDINQLYPNHHPDQHELVFFPDAKIMLSATDGGVHKTFDNTASSVSWVSLNNGYVTSQFYTLSISKDEGKNEIMGGMQDNGTYLKTQTGENTQWSSVLGGDGAYTASTPNNQYWYLSFQEAGIFRMSYNTDGSIQNWAKVDPAGIDRSSYLFVTPFVLDPNNYNRMYLAGDSAIWRNNNLSQITPFKQTTTSTNWEVIQPEISRWVDITALDISTNPAHILYYGTSIGEVYKITKANSPQAETEQVFSQNGYISSICIDPKDAGRVLICYSNYNVISLYLSEDGGNSFKNVGGNLEENADGTGHGSSIRWVEMIALQNGGYKYYVGTSMGLYSTTELAEQNTIWKQEGIESIGNSVVSMIDYRSTDGKIAIATHGNGVFESTVANTEPITSNAQKQDGVELAFGYPNPFKDDFHIKFTLPKHEETKIYIIDVSGKIVRSLLHTIPFEGDITVTWDGKNDNGNQVQNGLYQYLIIYQDKSYGGKMILNK
ncbi:flagellar basal body rod modification protein [Reichenbachiella carrageenanivorans]|uniref:Flagellar basal body rod modification protein n=1 Tax=Reichenbachiella carrageenanivorans TaxID=2979869 RepID=A0ABY6D2U4_9BACT|nr:FlgD immunoglobulin-like domain containing protein [Reichenbachiella carrageenanivorans]UXX80438.1 flagellar basal body rod modification protein [Reichenbachiella carrageenanivorans]